MGKNEQKRRGTEAKLKQEAMRLRSERSVCPRRDSHLLSRATGYAVRRPRNSANVSGTPKSLMLTCPSAGARALRVRRSVHESRKCARCARERIAGEGGGLLWLGRTSVSLISMC
jgi:hypothetical protein